MDELTCDACGNVAGGDPVQIRDVYAAIWCLACAVPASEAWAAAGLGELDHAAPSPARIRRAVTANHRWALWAHEAGRVNLVLDGAGIPCFRVDLPTGVPYFHYPGIAASVAGDRAVEKRVVARIPIEKATLEPPMRTFDRHGVRVEFKDWHSDSAQMWRGAALGRVFIYGNSSVRGYFATVRDNDGFGELDSVVHRPSLDDAAEWLAGELDKYAKTAKAHKTPPELPAPPDVFRYGLVAVAAKNVAMSLFATDPRVHAIINRVSDMGAVRGRHAHMALLEKAWNVETALREECMARAREMTAPPEPKHTSK